jgi:WD40 repeat protein
MSDEERIDELLDRWEELREQGTPISLEKLCADCPHLLEPLRRRIQELELVDDFLGSGVAAEEVFTAGRYRAARLLAPGGLGGVSLAEDDELDRKVALKRLHPRWAGDTDARRRFEQEPKVTALLEHPGVVPIYGLGEDQAGRPCYAMRLIRGRTPDDRGQTLDDAIAVFHAADRPGRDPGERAVAFQNLLRRMLSICQTIAYAHSRGVLHRDLKPANIMVGDYGETLVVDWGLAKVLTREDKGLPGEGLSPAAAAHRGDTMRGQVNGTPAYMSPEQAAGHPERVGPRSDIYCLGATLYKLLTGRAPFPSDSPEQVLPAVRAGRFPGPRSIKPGVPAALEAVCLKAMHLDPARRYASAQELAEDIEHWLADEPVSAWQEPWAVRARRWMRRHRTVMAATAAALLVAVGTLGVATALLADKNQALARETHDKKEARRQASNRADQLAERLYLSGIWLADHALGQPDVALAEQALAECAAALRGPEWHYLKRLCRDQGPSLPAYSDTVWGVALSPDAQHLAVVLAHNEIHTTDLVSGKSERLAPGDDRKCVLRVSFSPDGQGLLAVYVNQGVRVFDAHTGKEAVALAGLGKEPADATFSADGRTILVACLGGLQDAGNEKPTTVEVFDARTRARLRSIPGIKDQSRSQAALSPGGRYVAWFAGIPLKGRPNRIVVQDLGTGETVVAIDTTEATPQDHLALSADGRFLAVTQGGPNVRLWDLRARAGQWLVGHSGSVHALAFSPDSRSLATTGEDSGVRVWSTETDLARFLHRGHRGPVWAVTFSSDGKRLASGGEDKTVRLWEMRPSEATTYRLPPSTARGLSPDGRRLVTADDRVRFWDLTTGAELPLGEGWDAPAPPAECRALAHSGDGRCLALAGSRDILLLEATTYKLLTTMPLPANRGLGDLGLSRDGTRLLAIVNEVVRYKSEGPGRIAVIDAGELVWQEYVNRAVIWDTPSGRRLWHVEGALRAVLSASSELLATSSQDGKIHLWDVKSGREVRTLAGDSVGIRRLAFSPDERLLASGSMGAVRMWNVETGQEVALLEGHTDLVPGLVFSPDGMALASGGEDGTVRLWHVASRQRLLTLRAPARELVELAFSGSGDRLVAIARDSSGGEVVPPLEVTIWDMRPAAQP